MKTIKLTLLTLLVGSTVLTSCKKDKNVYADDFSVSIAENPDDNLVLGTIIATTEKSYITYTLLSESVTGALAIDGVTGELTVKDPEKFNFEVNPSITAQIEASNGKNEDISNVIITLTDVDETPAMIGDFRDGGVVFWVDPIDNSKGLVCSVVDQSSSGADWGCYDILNPTSILGADGTAVGTGNQNTIDIEAECTTAGTAADICANLTLNTFSDWFLPSKDEMTEMFSNKTAINTTATANGGSDFDESVYYWTSSESTVDGKAYEFYFLDGASTPTLKLNYFSVRAVRAF